MAIELLLKLAGVEGEAERDGFEKQIQLDSFDWSFHNSSSPTGAGAGAGKVEARGITCTKRVDKSSPKLFQAITTGKHFANGKVTVTYNEQKADGTKGAATVASYDFKKHVSG